MTVDEDFDIPSTGAIFTFGKSRFAENAPSKFWIKNDIICKVACGDEHTAIVTGSGRVFTIGNNSNGQLGLGHRLAVPRPSCVKALKPQRVTQVACGRAHTVVATEIGCVFSWGHNGDGQLGSGNLDDKESPCEILKLPLSPLQLAAGSAHTMLLTDKGEVYVWGSNREGQLGCDGEYKLTPMKLILGNKMASIICGYYHSLAITEDCQLISWGEAEHGKLGLNEDLLTYQHFPQPVKIIEKIVMAAAGSSHSLVLTERGCILSCGTGSSGQLGLGALTLKQHILKPILGLEETRFVYISAGDNHSAAISEDGLVYTWGCGRHGKLCLGERNFTSQFKPVPVNRLQHLMAIQVACGGCHTMVLGQRRLDESQNPSAISAPIKETKGPSDSPLNNIQTLNSKQISKATILPTIPTQNVTDELEGDPQQYSHIQLQENYWGVGGEDIDDPEFAQKREEGRLKASRFAHFWRSLLKREKGTTSYQSRIDDPKQSECTSQPAKLEDLENNAGKYPKGVEYEEEAEGGDQETELELDKSSTEQKNSVLDNTERGGDNDEAVWSRTCVLF